MLDAFVVATLVAVFWDTGQRLKSLLPTQSRASYNYSDMRFATASAVFLFLASALFASQVPPGFEDVPIATALNQPTACEFAPDGRLFILLKQGGVRIVKDGQLLPGTAL